MSIRVRNPVLSRFPKSKWHDEQSQINDMEKCITKNADFKTVLRAGARVQARRAAVSSDSAFSHLSLRNANAPGLAQMGRGVLIGQSACKLLV